MNQFNQTVGKENQINRHKVKTLCETRWVEKHTVFEDVHMTYSLIIQCLDNVIA